MAATELDIFILRIAMKRPVRVLHYLLNRVMVHKKNLRVQAYLLHLIQNIVQPMQEVQILILTTLLSFTYAITFSHSICRNNS